MPKAWLMPVGTDMQALVALAILPIRATTCHVVIPTDALTLVRTSTILKEFFRHGLHLPGAPLRFGPRLCLGFRLRNFGIHGFSL